MKTKTHFAFRVDIWDDIGDSIVEHIAGVDDFADAARPCRMAAMAASGSNATTRHVCSNDRFRG